MPTSVRQSFRALRRSPAFTSTTVLVLALGIGATTAVFSVVYGILLRPLPYREADRLVLVAAERDYQGPDRAVPANFSLMDLEWWHDGSGPFEKAALFAERLFALRHHGGTEVVHGAYVTGSFFDTVGGRMKLGRPLLPADATAPLAVISERLWLRRFGGSSDVLGRTLTLDVQSYTIVGVASASFQLPGERTDVWTSAEASIAHDLTLAMPGNRGFHPIARLKRNTTLEAARAHAQAVARDLTRAHPDAYGAMRATAVALHHRVVGSVEPVLLLTLASVGLVLFVACSNVAGLLLTRGIDRTREIAVRTALGASRRRLVQEAMVESALLTAMGATIGLMAAFVLTRLIVRLAPPGLPRIGDVQLDAPVLLFAAALASITALVVGTWPAWRTADVAPDLRVGHAGVRGGRYGRRTRRALVTLEIAVSLTLAVGAVLLARSVVELLRSDLGVASERLIVADLHLAFGRELSAARQTSLARRLVQRAASIPGVQAAGIATARPPNRATYRVTLNRRDAATGEESDVLVDAVAVTPTYFGAAGVRVVKGRSFTDGDDASATPVAIMTSDAARLLFGNADPLGKTLSLPFYRDGRSGQDEVTLVGIVTPVKYSGLDRSAEGAIYRPYAQHPLPMAFLAVRASGADLPLKESLRREIGLEDPQVTVIAVNSLDESVQQLAAEPLFRVWLIGLLAGLAVVVSAAGLYGVVAHSVAARTGEVGVRMALGSTPGHVVSLMMREGLLLATVGIALGLCGAIAATRAIRTLLFGVAALDPVSFAGAAFLLLCVTVLATYLPARRAARVDPMVALRAE